MPVMITADGPDLRADVHGAKALGLQRLLRLGCEVPPAFVIPIGAVFDGEALAMARGLGSLLAVRSGAAVSLPGALETRLGVTPDGLAEAIDAVVASAEAERASATAGALGFGEVVATAVIVQRQVDATADALSGAGAASSRDPVSGESTSTGSFVWQRMGDRVMAGTDTPSPLRALAARLPEAHRQLLADLERLDHELGTAVEVEFAIERGTLWYLQMRTFDAAESPPAKPVRGEVLATGTPASAGAARGRVYTDVDDALDAADRGEPVVLVRPTTSPADVAAMVQSVAVVTALGGRESHAAVIARSIGVPAVVAVGGLEIAADHVRFGDERVRAGEELHVDGTTGRVTRPAPHPRTTVGP